MTDFTIEVHQICRDASEKAMWSVGNYQQWVQNAEIHCSCKGFKFRKTCKHLNEIEKETRCDWYGFLDEVQTEEQEKNQICPRCGGPTEFIRVAV